MTHHPVKTRGTAHAELLSLLDQLSRLQWQTFQRDFDIPLNTSRADYVSSVLLEDIPTTVDKVHDWQRRNECTLAAESFPLRRERVALVVDPESALERLFATHEPLRCKILGLLHQTNATQFRACSCTCKQYVASFCWPAQHLRVTHLDRWRACFPQAVGVVLGGGLRTLSGVHLAGLKEINVFEKAVTNDVFSSCNDLLLLNIPNQHDVSDALLDYMPNLIHLECCVPPFTLRGISKLRKLKTLSLHFDGTLTDSHLALIPPSVERLALHSA
jgi:hypothetical protein